MYLDSGKGQVSMKHLLRLVTLAVAAFILAGYLPSASRAATTHREKRVALVRVTHETEQPVVRCDPAFAPSAASIGWCGRVVAGLIHVSHASPAQTGLEPRQGRAPPGGVSRA